MVEYLRVFRHVGFFLFLALWRVRNYQEWAATNFNKKTYHVHDFRKHPLRKGVAIMGGKTDVVKGRIKEAAGALTGNDKLRAEGRTDQVVGKT